MNLSKRLILDKITEKKELSSFYFMKDFRLSRKLLGSKHFHLATEDSVVNDHEEKNI